MKSPINKIDFQLVNGFITTHSELSQSVISRLKETGAVVQQIIGFAGNKPFLAISGNLINCVGILKADRS